MEEATVEEATVEEIAVEEATIEKINVSIGELWDKYTILLIKREKISDEVKLEKINNEIKFLDKNMKKYSYQNNELFLELESINKQLWEIEDKIRIKESLELFDYEFIQLARKVYITNDNRAFIKNEINKKFNSDIYEVKEYVEY